MQSYQANEANEEGNELVFVIETCQNCKDHHWNTRHDEAKYAEFFNRVSSAIVERIPNALTMRNQIPKSYLHHDLYCNLIPNDDENIPYFQQVPRTGSFEVSYKGLLIFSKLQGGYWPNSDLVATKCQAIVEEESNGRAVDAYLAGNSPTKDGGSKASTVKSRRGKGPRDTQTRSFGATGFSDSQPLRQPENQQQNQPEQFEQNFQAQQQESKDDFQQPEVNEASRQQPIQDDSSQKFISGGASQHSVVEQEPAQQAPKEVIQEVKEIKVEMPVTVGSHLKTADDLTGFPTFKDGEQGSLLYKYLSKDVWKNNKDKVDAHGFSFKQAIFSGCKNTDSGIGVYAGSPDSYAAFSDIFNPIIEDYHKVSAKAGHVSDMDYKKLNTPAFPEDEAKMIKSTRIRVGRNLAEFPLGPGVSKEERAQIEEYVTKGLSNLDGDLKGKYYSLDSLTEKERQQLIEDHFLFKEGDRFLEACNLNREWPANRGIFHNEAKTFLVWVNEEDQLRIISMQQGSDIGQVFSRLSRACEEIEKIAKFAVDSELGNLTSCPTNLGTALRASVHIHLPELGKDKDLFKSIADKFHVQIRGAHGEHTETDDHIYDISNKRRLGRSEVALVQDMYDGVKAMIDAEKALNKSQYAHQESLKKKETRKVEAKDDDLKEDDDAKDTPAGPHLKTPEDIKGFPVFPTGTKSLLSKYLSRDIWVKYKDLKDKHGFPFRHAILSGSQNVDSGIGVYAGSHDSYTTFKDLFDQVIQDYHGHKPADKHVSNMDYTKLDTPPFPEEDAKMIRSTRIRVGRNLAEFPLGPGISREQREKIEEQVTKACNSFDGELKGTYYSLASLSEKDRKQLIDDHFLFKEGDRFLEACGLNRNWPEGRGIFHNNSKTFLVWVNEEDQLRIISMQQGADIGEVFTRLSKAAAHIETVAKFAHDDHLGFITSCPTNLGTALRASVHIHLPNLGLKKDQFQEIASKYFVQIRGAHGEHTETDDHIYDISNIRRLGRSEVDLVQDMYNGVKAMIEAEKVLAKK